MIIKETEAKKYNCHYPDALHCAGAHCMAWRWADTAAPELKDDGLNIRRIFSTTHGYCGLAGRP